MIKKEIEKLIKNTIKELQKEKKLPKFNIPEILIEHPIKVNHGDYSTNVALQIAKIVKKSPTEIAELINWKSQIGNWKFLDKVEVREPGFINFFISKGYLQKQIEKILKEGEKFGQIKIGKNQKVNVEFISANPTGPLTLGNGRGGFCGDVLSNVLIKAGFKVKREYYINDRGEQIKKLGHSIIGDSQAVYKGKYIEDLRKRVKDQKVDEAGQKAAKIILGEMIKPVVKKIGINFDIWFSEKSLYKNKEVDNILNWLEDKKLVYKKEGALWFKSTKFGDDKDRVLVKADGEKTYFLSDIAYLKNKFQRRFNHLIYFLGADHYGYVKRMESAVEALGYQKEQMDFIVMQLVHIFEKGKQVRMSKRKGVFIKLEDLIDEVGLDVARFFFLTKSPGVHLNFNLDLAKSQSEKNPVYYVQYAHARIHSILAKSKNTRYKIPIYPAGRDTKYELLNHPSELNLIKQLIKFPEIITDTAKDYQVQRLPNYALKLVAAFHKFYEEHRVLTDDKRLSQARLGLVGATKIVLKNTLDLMGISAPSKM